MPDNDKQEDICCPMQNSEVKKDVTDIKIAMEVLLQRTGWIENNVKECKADRDKLYKRTNENKLCIAKIKVKQGVVTWLACAFTLTGLGVVGKWIFNHIKN